PAFGGTLRHRLLEPPGRRVPRRLARRGRLRADGGLRPDLVGRHRPCHLRPRHPLAHRREPGAALRHPAAGGLNVPRTKEFEPGEALDAAMQLFWCKGYAATSLRDLLDGMGIGYGSFYNT